MQDNHATLNNYLYKPLFFDKSNPADVIAIQELIDKQEIVFVYDQFERQLRDLFVCRNPTFSTNEEQFLEFVGLVCNQQPMEELGAWVYYPWRKTLVHILEREEFIEVRTNRNQLKISKSEQELLSTKTIGIIGLSVGQSVAITIAMERGCGKLKLADFDDLDLSNLNRLRAPIFSLGFPKVVLAAREIAEIDPYLEVEIYPEGIKEENYQEFLIGSQKLDLLIEVCDNFEVKVESRIQAREFGIPVIMETNDRAMLDIERFDKIPDLKIFHGLVGDLTVEEIHALDKSERMGLLMKIVNAKDLSDRMKQSLPELGKSLKSWPQLASEVVLGGGISAWASRKLLLGQDLKSGRYYVDLEKILSAHPVN